MTSFLNNITTFMNNQSVNLNNIVGNFRSDYFDTLEEQIEVLEEKKKLSPLSSDEEYKLASLIEQRDNLNESVEYKSDVKHRLGIYFFKVKKYDGTDSGSDAIISNVIYFPGNTMGTNDLTKPLQALSEYTNQSILEINKGLNYINNGSFFPDNNEIQEKQEDFDKNKRIEIVAISEKDGEGEINLKQGRDEIVNRFQKLVDDNKTQSVTNVPQYASDPLKIINFREK